MWNSDWLKYNLSPTIEQGLSTYRTLKSMENQFLTSGKAYFCLLVGSFQGSVQIKSCNGSSKCSENGSTCGKSHQVVRVLATKASTANLQKIN